MGTQTEEDASHKRDSRKRVFVNRSLNLSKIKYFGFDMDYTLAEYISPEFEDLGFRLTLERLIATGYPDDLRSLRYDHTFAVRGLWFDSDFGNLLKMDAYGNILLAVHGHHFLSEAEIRELYPNKNLAPTSSRVYILNTLFNLPESCLLAALVHYFDRKDSAGKDSVTLKRKGIRLGSTMITYRNIFQDTRAAVDYAHIQGDLKGQTLANISKFVRKDPRLPVMLDRLRQQGAKVFLLTNSGFAYTNKVMGFLLDERPWRSYFDYVLVDAGKPRWFGDGTALRQVDTASGALGIGSHVGPLLSSDVYSGGSCDEFCRLVGIRSGREVLYVGDHIFGDVLRSKKSRGWRTFLVVPELQWELEVWTQRRELWDRLGELERQIGRAYLGLDSGSTQVPDVSKAEAELGRVKREMDRAYSAMGSLFRSGSRLTFFASQVERYADLYAGSAVNLLYYPKGYYFRAPPMLMPHESTVEHAAPSVVGEADAAFPLPPVLPRGFSKEYLSLPDSPGPAHSDDEATPGGASAASLLTNNVGYDTPSEDDDDDSQSAPNPSEQPRLNP